MKKILFFVFAMAWGMEWTFCQHTVPQTELIKIKKTYYLDGEPFTGTAVAYDSVAKSPYTFTVVNGTAEGVRIWYYDEDMTKIRFIVPLVKGLQHGLYVGYNEDGTISFTLPQKKHNKHGIRYCYSDGGALWHIHHYRRDRETGVRTSFYTGTGNISTRSKFRKGQLHGRLYSYRNDESNGLQVVRRYKRGKIDGVVRTYNPEGEVIKKEKYKNGLRKD